MLPGLVARKLHRRVLSPAALTFFQKRFASGEGLVSIHSLAVYIHEQINGTFEDIFHQLSGRVDLLEYPNSGSSTLVTMGDAEIIVEDIGAHADGLPAFLADDEKRDKFIGFPMTEQSSGNSLARVLVIHFTQGTVLELVPRHHRFLFQEMAGKKTCQRRS